MGIIRIRQPVKVIDKLINAHPVDDAAAAIRQELHHQIEGTGLVASNMVTVRHRFDPIALDINPIKIVDAASHQS